MITNLTVAGESLKQGEMPLLEASNKFLQPDSSTLQDGIFQSLPSYNPNQQKVFYDDNLYDGYNDWD